MARAIDASTYVTLDDATALEAAQRDPQGFIQRFEGTVVLDEIQRVPQLFLAIKAEVDRNRRPGRFVLTGSANVMLLPRLSESLAGRMEILTLWPFSVGELKGIRETFVDRAFGEEKAGWPTQPQSGDSLDDAMLRGGYPEVALRTDPERRRAWFTSYVMTLLQRDVRDLANIDHLALMPRLAAMLAARTGTLLNAAELSRSLGLPLSTLQRYLVLLESIFAVQTLPAWSTNLGKRLVRSPKVFLCDTGLTAHLCSVDKARLNLEPEFRGRLLESFVLGELRKQAAWNRARPHLYHFRSHAGQEVDIVMEGPGGDIVGIEVKASSTVTWADFKGLKYLQDALGKRFHRGIVLYTGSEAVPFGKGLEAVPVESLWRTP